MRDLYDIAREVTDEVMGEGTYEDLNKGNPDPGVQRAIARAPRDNPFGYCEAYIEKGGIPLAKSRGGKQERRHRKCKRLATRERVVDGRRMALCGSHGGRVDRGLPINTKSDW